MRRPHLILAENDIFGKSADTLESTATIGRTRIRVEDRLEAQVSCGRPYALVVRRRIIKQTTVPLNRFRLVSRQLTPADNADRRVCERRTKAGKAVFIRRNGIMRQENNDLALAHLPPKISSGTMIELGLLDRNHIATRAAIDLRRTVSRFRVDDDDLLRSPRLSCNFSDLPLSKFKGITYWY